MCSRKALSAVALAFISSALLVAAPVSFAQAPLTVDDLLGIWRWQGSSGGFVGETIEPTADLWMQLKFEPESKLHASLSGIRVDGTYSLSSEPGEPQTLRLDFVVAPSAWPLPYLAQTFLVSSPVPDELVLDEGCCDRYVHGFAYDTSSFVPIESSSLSEFKACWERGSN